MTSSLRLTMYIGNTIVDTPMIYMQPDLDEKIVLLNYVLQNLKFSLVRLKRGLYSFSQRDISILKMLNLTSRQEHVLLDSSRKIIFVDNQKLSSSYDTDTFFIK